MGCDIHPILEVCHSDRKWYEVDSYEVPGHDLTDELGYNDFPLNYRSYGLFGFLADVRNYSHVPPISEPRGLPEESEYLSEVTDEWYEETRRQEITDGFYHSHSWLLLSELLAFDYEQPFEDRRTNKVTRFPNGAIYSNGAADAGEGNGIITTFRDFLGPRFFLHLEAMKTYGKPEDVRFTFWFDN